MRSPARSRTRGYGNLKKKMLSPARSRTRGYSNLKKRKKTRKNERKGNKTLASPLFLTQWSSKWILSHQVSSRREVKSKTKTNRVCWCGFPRFLELSIVALGYQPFKSWFSTPERVNSVISGPHFSFVKISSLLMNMDVVMSSQHFKDYITFTHFSNVSYLWCIGLMFLWCRRLDPLSEKGLNLDIPQKHPG